MRTANGIKFPLSLFFFRREMHVYVPMHMAIKPIQLYSSYTRQLYSHRVLSVLAQKLWQQLCQGLPPSELFRPPKATTERILPTTHSLAELALAREKYTSTNSYSDKRGNLLLPVLLLYRASTHIKLLSSQSQVFPTSFFVPTHE